MRPVKRRHDAIHLEPDPRTGSFDDCRVKRPEKCLDSAPLDRAKRSFAQDCECFPMRGIHKLKISHFGIVSARICALWKTGALNLPTLKIWMRWTRPTNKMQNASRRYINGFAANCGLELARRCVRASVLVDQRRDLFGAWRRLLKGRCRFSFPGTVYFIGLSESPDQVLRFALAAASTSRSPATSRVEPGHNTSDRLQSVFERASGRPQVFEDMPDTGSRRIRIRDQYGLLVDRPR